MIAVMQAVVMIVFPLSYCFSRYRRAEAMRQKPIHENGRILAEGFLVSFLLYLGWFASLPIWMWTVIYYLFCLLTCGVGVGGRLGAGRLHRHLVFIYDITICFLFLGVAARILDTDQVTAMETLWVHLGYVLVAVMVHIISNLIAGMERVRYPWIELVKSDAPEGNALNRFLWFTVIFLFLESFLLKLPLPVMAFSDLYLIGSNLLVLMVVVISVFYTMQIYQKLEDKKEFFLLRKEMETVLRRMELLEQTVYEDKLTGLHSRHSAFQTMKLLKKEGKLFSIVFIDLDNLKKINDEKGHRAGDRYLLEFAEKVHLQLREDDVFARVGGDEFLIILPGSTLEITMRRMNGIRDRLQQEDRPGGPIRFSFGVAQYPGRTQQRAASAEISVEKLVVEADRRMYKDKRRNRAKKAVDRQNGEKGDEDR